MRLDLRGPLPVRVEPHDDESGMSFVMRSFWRNGMTLRDARHWLQVSFSPATKAQDVRLLAWAVQVTPSWLAHRTFIDQGGHQSGRLRLADVAFSRACLLAGNSARVCPACIRELGFCRVAWALKHVPVCTRHCMALLHTCTNCRAAISWDRLRLDICRCGHYLTGPVEPQRTLNSVLTAWVRWVEDRLAVPHGHSREPQAEGLVPRLLSELTLDGACRLVEAFGAICQPNESPRVVRQRLNSPGQMSTVIVRGLERIRAAGDDLSNVQSLKAEVDLVALERMRDGGLAPGDERCAELLIERIRERRPTDADMRGRFKRGQLPLFG